jgi:hypothetical protein
MSKEEILAAALSLTARQRAALAQKLLRSLDDASEHEAPEDTAKDWDRELARRVDAIRRGSAKTTPWPEAKAKIERRLAARRRKNAPRR